MDSKLWISDSTNWIPDFDGGTWFQIPIVSDIPDSFCCIPDFKAQVFEFHKQKISMIPESGFPYMEGPAASGHHSIKKKDSKFRGIFAISECLINSKIFPFFTFFKRCTIIEYELVLDQMTGNAVF